jgi:type VI secretion system protein VasI
MNQWIFSVFLLFTFTVAQSNINQEVLACITLNDSAQRLACYDTLANKINPPKVSNIDSWTVETETNPIDDSKTVYAINIATEGRGKFGEPIMLYLRCQSGEIESFIAWNDYLGLDSTEVTYRVGTSEAKTSTWNVSTDNTATFLPGPKFEIKQFISDLASSDNGRFVAQVTPYNENTVTAIFEVSGLTGILPQLYEPCP